MTLYDAILLIIDGVALGVFSRVGLRGRLRVVCAWGLAANLLAVVLGALQGANGFGLIGSVSHALFFHLPVVGAIAAGLVARSSRRGAFALALAALSVAAVGVDAFLIEPRSIEVGHVSIAAPTLGRALRVVVLADLQTDVFTDHERNAFALALAEKPDLILLAGDYVQIYEEPARLALQDELRRYLAEIHFSAPLGVHAVRGNNDEDDWARLFEGLPVEVHERTRSIDLPGLRLTALSCGDSYDGALAIPRVKDRFHVVLGHYPDFALGRVEADLLVAGHTHGGQVALPFLGPIMTLSRVPRAWASGVTRLDGERTLVVSRGIGMERSQAPRMRLLCRPELTVLDLAP